MSGIVSGSSSSTYLPCHVLNAERVILLPLYSTHARQNRLLIAEAEGDLKTACGACKHTLDLRCY